jgi:hypothetical protein
MPAFDWSELGLKLLLEYKELMIWYHIRGFIHVQLTKAQELGHIIS